MPSRQHRPTSQQQQAPSSVGCSSSVLHRERWKQSWVGSALSLTRLGDASVRVVKRAHRQRRPRVFRRGTLPRTVAPRVVRHSRDTTTLLAGRTCHRRRRQCQYALPRFANLVRQAAPPRQRCWVLHGPSTRTKVARSVGDSSMAARAVSAAQEAASRSRLRFSTAAVRT